MANCEQCPHQSLKEIMECVLDKDEKTVEACFKAHRDILSAGAGDVTRLHDGNGYQSPYTTPGRAR